MANFSLATSRRYKDRDGNRKDETEWHNIVCFGKSAEIAGQYLTKGKMIFVEGRIQTRSWEDKEGKKQYRTEIICENFQMLGSKGDGSGGGALRRRRAPSADTGAGGGDHAPDFGDDDIPF